MKNYVCELFIGGGSHCVALYSWDLEARTESGYTLGGFRWLNLTQIRYANCLNGP